MLLEMHTHTTEYSSCSRVSAKDLIRQVHAKGLDGVVFTDHHHQWSPEELRAQWSAAEVPKDFLVLSGQEVTTDFGDVLVFGADRSFPRGTPVMEIREAYPEAALVWAHPYRNNRTPPDEKFLNRVIDAVEIFNSNHSTRDNIKGLHDWHRLRFTATAGTDTHAVSYAGIYPTLFHHPFETIEGMAKEIREGRCLPYLSETPHFGAGGQVLEVGLGKAEGAEAHERVLVRIPESLEEHQTLSRSQAVTEAMAARGFAAGEFRAPRPVDADHGSPVKIEQAVRGRSLFNALLEAPKPRGVEIIRQAAQWLARLHNARLVVTPPDEFLQVETERMTGYLENLERANNPHIRKFRELVEIVLDEEERIEARQSDAFAQGHGDFHPKNILIGEADPNETDDDYVAAIDFDRSMVQPTAFDIGSFLAQFRNQFFDHPEIRRNYPDKIFLDAYLESADGVAPDFQRQVELFRARANLSIASYFVSVGQGTTEKMWRVIIEAEHAVTIYFAGEPAV